jgi:hypothetical protein
MSETKIDWAAIHAGLSAPFDPADVDFRPQGQLTDRGQGLALAYIDARAVMDRLDAVVGAENWYGFPDVLIADTAVRVVRYGLTIHGVTKYAIGDAADTEASKSADSDGLKRAGVPWGIGRYLYALPREWVTGEPRGKNWIIPDGELKRLRAKLGAPPAQQQTQATQQAPGRAERPAGTPQHRAAAPSTPALITDAQQAQIRDLVGPAGMSMDALLTKLEITRLAALPADQVDDVIARLQARIEARRARAGAPDPASPVADTPRLAAVR